LYDELRIFIDVQLALGLDGDRRVCLHIYLRGIGDAGGGVPLAELHAGSGGDG
jgi:hypothetical protein